MKKVLVGYVIDGKKGGIDKFLMNMLNVVDISRYKVDFLSNIDTPELREYLSEFGSELHVISSLKHPVRQYREIKDILKRENYEVVYFNISEAFHTIGLIAAWMSNIPKRIVHSHSSGCDSKSITKWIRIFLHVCAKHTIIRLANIYVSCSDNASRWMFPKDICEGNKVQLILNGIDQEKFVFDELTRRDIRKSMNWENKKILFHVGNLTYVKNHDFLIRLTKRLVEKNKKFHLVLVGTGDLKVHIEEMIEKYELNENVEMLGLRSDVYELLQGCDYFLLPSFFEGFPISAVEAQVSGNLCLLSDTITKECIITDHCFFLDIEKIEDWENKILEEYNYEHKTFKNITNKVVDIKKQGIIFNELFS